MNKLEVLEKAEKFITQYYEERVIQENPAHRMDEIREQIEKTGTYQQTFEEVEYGARLAWRNSNRCIGRLYWESLIVRDMRHLTEEEDIKQALIDHIRTATDNESIKPVLTLFRQKMPSEKNGIRILNSQLIKYAGYEDETGNKIGDPSEVKFTSLCTHLGWEGKKTNFDILPVVFKLPKKKPFLFTLPEDLIVEVDIVHPTYEAFKELGLKWYSVPIVSNMALEIGGIIYSAAPFNGWYMGTEIGSRNFGDEGRYNMLPKIAECLNLNTKHNSTLWKDKAILELNIAVLHSFREKKIKMMDHHTASEQFIKFKEKLTKKNLEVTGDWTWITPPMSSSTTEVFHTELHNKVVTPNYFYQNYKSDDLFFYFDTTPMSASNCPYHLDSVETEPELKDCKHQVPYPRTCHLLARSSTRKYYSDAS